LTPAETKPFSSQNKLSTVSTRKHHLLPLTSHAAKPRPGRATFPQG